MTVYRLTADIDSDDDPSEILERFQEFAGEESGNDSELGEMSACVDSNPLSESDVAAIRSALDHRCEWLRGLANKRAEQGLTAGVKSLHAEIRVLEQVQAKL